MVEVNKAILDGGYLKYLKNLSYLLKTMSHLDESKIIDNILYKTARYDFDASKKLVITAGPPGIGKSTISNLVLGGLGFKSYDSDFFLQSLLKKENMPLKMNEYSDEQLDKMYKIRENVFRVIEKAHENTVSKGQGLIINITGPDAQKTIELANLFKERGYSVKMLYVDGSLDMALEGNSKRERSIPVEGEMGLISKYNKVAENKETFKNFFKDDFHYYYNSKDKTPSLINNEIQSLSKIFLNWSWLE